MKLIVATNNAHKVVEFKRILEPLGYEVLSQKDVGLALDVEETGMTFEENARLKAKAVFDAIGLPVVADDSGLEVDYLDRAPGIYSARFGGPDITNIGQCELILEQLKGVSKEKRTARFVCAICLLLSEDDIRSYVGTCEGYIGEGFRGNNGFGYDPIFMVNETDSFATLSGGEKDRISHRGIALRKLQGDLAQEQKHS